MRAPLRRACVAAALLVVAPLRPSPPLGAQAPVAPSAAPAPAGALTLDAVVARAIARGSSAKVARAGRDAARWRDRAFGARLLPQLGLTADFPNYSRAIQPIPQPDGTLRFLGVRRTENTAGLELSQVVPLTGGRLFVTSALSRVDITAVQGTAGRLWTSTPMIFGIEQDVFRPNRIGWDRREQDLRITAAERSYLETREDAATEAVLAFFELHTAQMALDNAVTNAAVNDTLYTLAKGRFGVGKIGENELLQAELALLRARAAADAQRLARDRARGALNLVLGQPADAPIAVAPPALAPIVAPDPEKAAEEARRNASRLTALELQEVQARRRVAEARASARFGMTIRASAGYNQTAPVFDGAYRSLLDQQRVGVSVTMPLVQFGAGRADAQAARAERESVAAEADRQRAALAQDARFAALGVAQAKRQLDLSFKADSVGEQRFEIAKNRYLIGKIGITDLYIAQSEKDAARAAAVDALRGYWVAVQRLRRLTLWDFAANAPIRED